MPRRQSNRTDPSKEKTTRAGGPGSKYPKKGTTTVDGMLVNSSTRNTALSGGARASRTRVAKSASDFSDLFADSLADSPDETTDTQAAATDEDESRAWGDADWPELPGEERDGDSTIGEETRDVTKVVADAQEQAERLRFKGVDVGADGETVQKGDMVWRPISELIAADYNPRAMDASEMAALKNSLEEFGMPEPVVVNTFPGRENVIVGGHQRVEAARQLGWISVPCTHVYINIHREKTLNLALNRISGRWDERLLAQIMAELDEAGADTAQTGFSQTEIDELLAMTADMETSIDLGDEFDSEQHREAGAAQIIISCPSDDYDPLIGETLTAAVDSLKARFPKLVIQRKGGA